MLKTRREIRCCAKPYDGTILLSCAFSSTQALNLIPETQMESLRYMRRYGGVIPK